MEFNYKGIRVIYNEDFDNEEAISDFLDELFEFYYEDLRNVKVIDFSNGDSDYFLIDGQPYQYSGGRLYLFDVENDEIEESFKGQEYFEYRNLCKELGLETYDQILAFVKEHNCKNDQELLNTLRDVVKSKNECVDDVRFMSEDLFNPDSIKPIEYGKGEYVPRISAYADNSGLYNRFKEEAKTKPYLVVETTDDYDPEGLDTDSDARILYAGSKDDCENYLLKRKNSAYTEEERGNATIEKEGEASITVYYPNAISRSTITIIENKDYSNLNEDLFNPEEAEEEEPNDTANAEEEKAEVSKEDNKEPQTFEEKMDFLAADEQEAIDGYEKIIATIDDEHVKEQLNKIMIEEKAHKEYLEKVKEDQSIDYTEPLEDEEESEDEKEEIDEDLKLREGKEVNDLS